MPDERLECAEEICVPQPAGASSAGAEELQQRLLAHLAHVGDPRPPKTAPTPGETHERRVAERWRGCSLLHHAVCGIISWRVDV